MTQLSYYKILRLKSSATPKEIDLAFKNLQVLYDNNKSQHAKEIMELIDEAYSVLRDPNGRANYDIANLSKAPTSQGSFEFTEAETVINSWGQGYTIYEEDYLERIDAFNKFIKVIVFILAAIFIWSVIKFRWDISGLIIFAIAFFRLILGSIYRIKNPPPPVEVWAVK